MLGDLLLMLGDLYFPMGDKFWLLELGDALEFGDRSLRGQEVVLVGLDGVGWLGSEAARGVRRVELGELALVPELLELGEVAGLLLVVLLEPLLLEHGVVEGVGLGDRASVDNFIPGSAGGHAFSIGVGGRGLQPHLSGDGPQLGRRGALDVPHQVGFVLLGTYFLGSWRKGQLLHPPA